ncbi:MAG: cation:proton antiporter subunit C [Desulfobulbaceae bacterium]|nr:cation:proton antiporter subunit C [Desulfobulbaceae bacterium]
MTNMLYSFTGLILFVFGLFALIVSSHPLRKILGGNVMSTGIFLFLVATSYRTDTAAVDSVPQAMVLTGIVVSVSITAVALVLATRLQQSSNRSLKGREKRGRDKEAEE